MPEDPENASPAPVAASAPAREAALHAVVRSQLDALQNTADALTLVKTTQEAIQTSIVQLRELFKASPASERPRARTLAPQLPTLTRRVARAPSAPSADVPGPANGFKQAPSAGIRQRSITINGIGATHPTAASTPDTGDEEHPALQDAPYSRALGTRTESVASYESSTEGEGALRAFCRHYWQGILEPRMPVETWETAKMLRKGNKVLAVWARLAGLSFIPDDGVFLLVIYPLIIQLILWHSAVMGIISFTSSVIGGSKVMIQAGDPVVQFLFLILMFAIALSYTVLRAQWVTRGYTFLSAATFVLENGVDLARKVKGMARVRFAVCLSFAFLCTLVVIVFNQQVFATFIFVENGSFAWKVNVWISVVLGHFFGPFCGLTVAGIMADICDIHSATVNVLLRRLTERAQSKNKTKTKTKALDAYQLIALHRRVDGFLVRSARVLELPITVQTTLFFVCFLTCAFILIFHKGRGSTGDPEEDAESVAVYHVAPLVIFVAVSVANYWILSSSSGVTMRCRRLPVIASLSCRSPRPPSLGTTPPGSRPDDANVHSPPLLRSRTLTKADAIREKLDVIQEEGIVASSNLDILEGRAAKSEEVRKATWWRIMKGLFPSKSERQQQKRRVRSIDIEWREMATRDNYDTDNDGADDGCQLPPAETPVAAVRVASSKSLASILVDHLPLGPPGVSEAETRPSTTLRSMSRQSTEESNVAPSRGGGAGAGGLGEEAARQYVDDVAEQLLLIQYFTAANSGWRVYDVLVTTDLTGRVLYGILTVLAFALQRTVFTDMYS